jgi:DNA-binding CsgD family transcriptional regulator
MNECISTRAFSESMISSRLDLALRAEAIDSDFAALLNRVDCGAIVLQQNCRVIAANPYARDLVGDGLIMAQGYLSLACRPQQDRLDSLLGRAFKGNLDEDGYMPLPRPSGKRPLLLQIIPLAQEASLIEEEFSAAAVLLIVFDIERRRAPPPSAALRALGLTPAEAAVATLVGTGLSPLDTSDRLCITVLTVRTHLKAIFQKLGLQRQGELVRIVSRLGMMS